MFPWKWLKLPRKYRLRPADHTCGQYEGGRFHAENSRPEVHSLPTLENCTGHLRIGEPPFGTNRDRSTLYVEGRQRLLPSRMGQETALSKVLGCQKLAPATWLGYLH